MVEELEQTPINGHKKSRRTCGVATSSGGAINSRTLCPEFKGDIPFVGGIRATDDYKGLELNKKEGGILGTLTETREENR